jgi:hypothetical protein
VLMVGPDPVLQRSDIEAKDHFLARDRVVLTLPFWNVQLVTAVIAFRFTRGLAYIRHGVIVFVVATMRNARAGGLLRNGQS